MKHPGRPNPDQDALNILFQNNYLKLPVKFNRLMHVMRKFETRAYVGREIIHYSSQSHGLNLADEFNRLWFSYYLQTPFYSEDALMDLVALSHDFLREVISRWRQVAILSSTRRRGFFMYPQDSDKVVDLIGKNNGDIGLNARFSNATDILIQSMEENRGKMIFFINVNENEYVKICDILLKRGFKKDEDFFNVKELTPIYDFKKLVLEF